MSAKVVPVQAVRTRRVRVVALAVASATVRAVLHVRLARVALILGIAVAASGCGGGTAGPPDRLGDGATSSADSPTAVASAPEAATSQVVDISSGRTAVAWLSTASPDFSLPDCPMNAGPLVDELSGLFAEDFSLNHAKVLDSADSATETPRAICEWLAASGDTEISVNLAAAPGLSRQWVDDLYAGWVANGDVSSTWQATEWRSLLDGEQHEGYGILQDPGQYVCYAAWVMEGVFVEAMFKTPGEGSPSCMVYMAAVMKEHVEELLTSTAAVPSVPDPTTGSAPSSGVETTGAPEQIQPEGFEALCEAERFDFREAGTIIWGDMSDFDEEYHKRSIECGLIYTNSSTGERTALLLMTPDASNLNDLTSQCQLVSQPAGSARIDAYCPYGPGGFTIRDFVMFDYQGVQYLFEFVNFEQSAPSLETMTAAVAALVSD